MKRQAVAYIRRSSGRESPLSLEAQQQAIQTAAAARGDTITTIFKDWGLSGGDRTRPQFLAMVEAIGAGSVSAVYTYDADRLGRRTATVAALLDDAEDAGTAIVDRHGRDLAAPQNRLTGEVLASVDAQVLRDITERNRANRDRKVARGDDLGEAPYGWAKVKLTEDGTNSHGEPAKAGAVVNVKVDEPAITTVLNAYHAAGSALGAAQLLNAIGHPTKRGRTWNNRAVAELVSREAPELLPARLGRKSARHYRVRLLSGILRCRCGNVMSPNGDGWTCAAGARGVHERPYNVQDAMVLPFVKDEADRLTIPGDILVGERADDERQVIEAKRPRLIDLYLDNTITKPMLDAKLAELDAALASIDRQEQSWEIPPRIDWQRESVETINATLRAMFTVRLGADMRPVDAAWTVPEWRADH